MAHGLSCSVARQILNHWTTREALIYKYLLLSLDTVFTLWDGKEVSIKTCSGFTLAHTPWVCVKFYTYRGNVLFVFFLILLLLLFFTLQYCIGFAIHQHASATGVHVFSILNPPPTSTPHHPSGSPQCTSPKLPVSCIQPGLAIRFLYGIVHVLMPFSQIILLLPLPQSPKDCSIHLCLFCCLAYRVVATIFLNSIYMH